MRGGSIRSSADALREVVRNPGIRRIEIAWAAGTAADWAFLVVLLVVAYDAGGALAVGLLGAVRVLPAIAAAPFATSLVERYRGDLVLTAINVVRAGAVITTAIVVGVGLPMWATYVLAGIVAGAGSLVRPIQSALLPALARTPDELVAANVASSTGEGLGTFAGPLIAGLLVGSTGSVATTVLVAGIFAVAAAAATGIRFEREADARGGLEGGPTTRIRISDVPRVLRSYPGPALVMADFVAQIFVRGLLITLIVVASIELLHMGDGGVGVLNASIGLGGLAGAIGALGLTGGRRLTTVFALALACWGLPLVVMGAIPAIAVALVALFVTGFSNSVLDVSGFTLIQRGVRNEDRVAAFAVFEALLGVGLLAGSLVAPALVAIAGARGGLVVAGVTLPVVAIVTARPIATHTHTGALTDDVLTLMRSNALFAPLPLTALERLAESLVPVSFSAGDTVMREGEPGDTYLLIAQGELDVRAGGRLLRTCCSGDGVGEIALLRQVPRTASVTARTNASAYSIHASSFLSAIAGPAAAAAAEHVAITRLAHSERVSAP